MYEQQSTETAKTKRESQKARCITPLAQVSAQLSCPYCPGMFRARIGLTSHL